MNVESYKDAAIPVLEADDLNSLLEQFEAIAAVKEPTIKLDNHVKKKSRKDAEIPVLEADDLNSLLEQFEAIPAVKEPTTKLDNFMKIESRKDAKIPVLHSKYLNSFIKKNQANEKSRLRNDRNRSSMLKIVQKT
ncbi:unnamed protein product [Arctia plantaginis]|uniref:Uncharacterized protein n=1 Tax=Arctia plantaginis TaxID=874455 RepID=A0A8S1BFA0_ARCPL|nr:unnamed protein product [Arctia plantaginis]